LRMPSVEMAANLVSETDQAAVVPETTAPY
jgi:hypothetical protein